MACIFISKVEKKKKKEMFLLVCLAIIMLAAAAAVISFGWSYGGALAEAIVERDIWRSGMIVR